MIAAGVFDERDGRHLELIHGEIREMTPPGPEHEEIVELLTEWSYSFHPGQSVFGFRTASACRLSKALRSRMLYGR